MPDDQRSPFDLTHVAGIAIEQVVRGSGPPLLFLHGGEGLEANLPFIDALAKSHTVIAPSHPGFGASALPEWFSSVDDLAHHYLDFLEQRDLRDVAVVGASFGGWIAAELATKGSSRISRLVLMDAVGVKFGGPDDEQLADIFFYTREELKGLSFKGAPLVRDPANPEEALRVARNREALALYGWSPYLHNPKLLHRLYRIRIPTLVVWGDSDKIASPDYGRAYAQALPGAGFEVIADAGHYPHIEQQQRVLDVVTPFLAGRAK